MLFSIASWNCFTIFADDMNFSVEAEIPDNQIDKSQTYFDLKVKPEQEQDLTIVLKNTSNASTIINIEPHTAVTNQNGVIDYGKNLPKDSSLKYQFTDIIEGEKKYSLEPNEVKKAIFHLKIPREKFKGKILGGFRIQKVSSKSEKQQSDSVEIENKYAYVIGAQLAEDDEKITPNIVLNNIEPTLQNYRTAITANLQNIMPVIVSGLEVEAKVYSNNKKEVLHKTIKSGMSMAPNSNFDFPISWDNQQLKNGKYLLALTAKDREGHSWIFNKKFEIKSKDSATINNEAVEIPKNNNKLFIVTGILLVIASLVIVLFFKKKKRSIG